MGDLIATLQPASASGPPPHPVLFAGHWLACCCALHRRANSRRSTKDMPCHRLNTPTSATAKCAAELLLLSVPETSALTVASAIFTRWELGNQDALMFLCSFALCDIKVNSHHLAAGGHRCTTRRKTAQQASEPRR